MEMATAVSPIWDPEIRDRNLRHANEVRSGRSRIRKDLKARRRRLDESLLEEPHLQSMKIYDLLLNLPKVGRVKTTRILKRLEISHSRSVEGLTERQRRELLAVFRGW